MPVSLLSAAPRVLFAADVFGDTPAVQALIRQLGICAHVVTPLADATKTFRNEQLAYQAFLADGGVAAYAERTARILQQERFDYALGFSAGASALWLNSAQDDARTLRQMILFYGSRIRDHRELQPQCPVRLIFAEQEASFEPAELVTDLRQRGHDAELVKDSRHGFMNVYSGGYQVQTHSRFIGELTRCFGTQSAYAA